MISRVYAIVAAGVLAVGCTEVHKTEIVTAPPAEDACTFYGYTPGTEAYRICFDREVAARRRGRMAADYAETQVVADAQDACVSYGLTRGSERYDRCVQREVAYRRPA